MVAEPFIFLDKELVLYDQTQVTQIETRVFILTPIIVMVAAWGRDKKPAPYLPSSINNCRTEESNIVCYSDNQTRESGSNKVSFKTKSIMQDFSKDGSFTVIYRNLVINSTPIAGTEVSEDDGEVGDDDDSASSGLFSLFDRLGGEDGDSDGDDVGEDGDDDGGNGDGPGAGGHGGHGGDGQGGEGQGGSGEGGDGEGGDGDD